MGIVSDDYNFISTLPVVRARVGREPLMTTRLNELTCVRPDLAACSALGPSGWPGRCGKSKHYPGKMRLNDYNETHGAPQGLTRCYALSGIDEAERRTVARIFALYPLHGASATAKQLNREGDKGKRGDCSKVQLFQR